MPSKFHNLKLSTFETIDGAFLDWLDNTMNIHSATNDGWKKVPIIWLTAERAFQIKNNKEIRNAESDSLVFPLISVERKNIVKTEVNKRPIPAHLFPVGDYRKGAITISRKMNQNKTRNFARADAVGLKAQPNFPRKNEKVVYQTISIPFPVYYDITYEINLRADYQQQMNEMMQPFMVYAGGINQFAIKKDEYTYEAFINTNISILNNLSSLAEKEKKYETSIGVKVLGYVIGADKNQDGPKITLREGPVQLRFQRERIVVGDINELTKEGFRS